MVMDVVLVVLFIFLLTSLLTGSIFIGDWRAAHAQMVRDREQHIRALEHELLDDDEEE